MKAVATRKVKTMVKKGGCDVHETSKRISENLKGQLGVVSEGVRTLNQLEDIVSAQATTDFEKHVIEPVLRLEKLLTEANGALMRRNLLLMYLKQLNEQSQALH